MLIVGIHMNAAGTEKSFLSFSKYIDYEIYDVELLLVSKTGEFLKFVPPQIKITDMGKWGWIFDITKDNAVSLITKNVIRKNPFFAFSLLPYAIKMKRGGL